MPRVMRFRQGQQGRLLVPVPPPGGGDLAFFAMDYSLGAAPTAGWANTRGTNANFTITREAGLGPSGEDVYQLAMNHVGPTGGDVAWGWADSFGYGAPFAYGSSAFFRFKFRFVSGTNGRAYEQDDSGDLSGVWRNKILIANDSGSGLTSRVIFNVELERDPFLQVWKVAKGGGNDPANATGYTPSPGTWEWMQFEIKYSSVADATDGAYRIWRNGTLIAEATGIVVNADGAGIGDLQFGAYVNNGLYSDGVITYQQTGFQIRPSFTSGWAP